MPRTLGDMGLEKWPSAKGFESIFWGGERKSKTNKSRKIIEEINGSGNEENRPTRFGASPYNLRVSLPSRVRRLTGR
jgi:hypothetical protein